jgi:hypothetical protein
VSDTTRWQRLEEAFHAAVDVPGGAARDTLVRELCGHDADLAAEVGALIAEDTRLRDTAPAADAGQRGASSSATCNASDGATEYLPVSTEMYEPRR